MNFQLFTLKAQESIKTATDIADSYGNQQIEPIHLLAAFVQEKDGLIQDIIKRIGGNLNNIIISVNDYMQKLPKVDGALNHYLSNQLNDLFNASLQEAKSMKDEYVGIEHIFLMMTDKKYDISNMLIKQGINRESILKILQSIRGNNRITDQNAEDKYMQLKRFGRDLTDWARSGKLDPVIGREDEIRRVLQVLSRRTKNNPVLIGEPGVGKTAVVEGIAQRIISGDVPETLKSRSIVVLDTATLVAGTSYRGQFEERLKSLIKEVSDSEGEIILFIDEIHTLIGAGATSGAMDAANILKPALARGELHCIGATTLDEYQKHIEKDAALERRFQKVLIDEPDVESTISILRGLKEKYEVHHGVRITDGAIVAASELSNRYIPDRFLPDKAIDLIDEAASKLRIEIDSMPDEIDALDRRIRQLEIEKQALLREIKLT
ncbi:Clp protease N-terminal domain-containing protein [Candidatus Kapaibacterium sp.]